MARCADPRAEGIAVAEVDLDWVRSVRERMPLAQHREQGAPALGRVAAVAHEAPPGGEAAGGR